jgi:hypothetical protein
MVYIVSVPHSQYLVEMGGLVLAPEITEPIDIALTIAGALCI